MDVKQVLRELMALPEQRSPVASVYLDTRRLDQHQRQAIRVFVHDHVRAALKSAGRGLFDELQATLEPIEDYVTALLRQRVDEWATGLAIFSCAPGKLLRVVRTRLPFEPSFQLDPRPQLLPLARIAQLPPLLVAAVDSGGGYLFEASSGVVDVEARIDRPFPGRHGMGGWSQANYERHIEHILDRNLEAAAAPLVRTADLILDAEIVLAGQPILLAELERFLPQRVLERVTARIAYPSFKSGGELRETLLRDAWAKVQEARRERAVRTRDVALAESSREGLAVAGTKEVLVALNEGRVHKLLLDPGWFASGWACGTCQAIGEAEHEECPYCGSELSGVDLREETVRRALGSDAEVVFLSLEDRLPAGMGMLAQLRPGRTMNLAPTLGNVPLGEQ